MSKEQPLELDDRTQQAIAELQQTISDRYPTAQFAISRAPDDADIIHLITTVDVDDPDEVGDLVIDRVAQLVAEERIPIHVIPIRTPQRVIGEIEAERASGQARRRRTIPLFGRLPLGDR
jgi:hypothetical protein